MLVKINRRPRISIALPLTANIPAISSNTPKLLKFHHSKTNYPPLFTKLLEDVNAWSDVSLSWGELSFPGYCTIVQKGSRIAQSTMYTSKGNGRFGKAKYYINKYYIAAELTQLQQLHSKHRPTWMSLEAPACSPLRMDLVLWTPSQHRKAI